MNALKNSPIPGQKRDLHVVTRRDEDGTYRRLWGGVRHVVDSIGGRDALTYSVPRTLGQDWLVCGHPVRPLRDGLETVWCAR